MRGMHVSWRVRPIRSGRISPPRDSCVAACSTSTSAVSATASRSLRFVFGETLIAVQFDEVFKQSLDQIECIRAVGVTSKQHSFESSSILDRFCVFGFVFFVFGHSGCSKVTLKRRRLRPAHNAFLIDKLLVNRIGSDRQHREAIQDALGLLEIRV